MYIAAQGAPHWGIKHTVFNGVNAHDTSIIDCSKVTPEAEHEDQNPGQWKAMEPFSHLSSTSNRNYLFW